jgi:5-methylcytosine-specific restriction endonuclease McrA
VVRSQGDEPRPSPALRLLVVQDAGERCGYCSSSSLVTGMPLVLEHLVPKAKGGPTVRENLWLSCYRCNEFKGRASDAVDPDTGERVMLFNPR